MSRGTWVHKKQRGDCRINSIYARLEEDEKVGSNESAQCPTQTIIITSEQKENLSIISVNINKHNGSTKGLKMVSISQPINIICTRVGRFGKDFRMDKQLSL